MAKGKRGGRRKGSGRKPKVEEQKIVEKLKPLDGKAFKALSSALEESEPWAVKLFFNYRFGMPVQRNINENRDIDSELNKLEKKSIDEEIND